MKTAEQLQRAQPKPMAIGRRAKMKTRYQKYQIEWPNGEKEIVKVPAFFQPSEVVHHLPYSVVEIIIDAGFHAYAENWPRQAGRVEGPAVLRVNELGQLFI